MTNSTKDKIKLIAADTLARLLVYGPLAVAAVAFAPTALVVIGLAAAQPWLGEGLGIGATWLEKKVPSVMGPIDRLISRYAGMQWWKHAGVLITALAVAIVPAPPIAEHLPHIMQSALKLLGGVDQTWTEFVLPFALATALPFATNMATKGFEWAFQQIPWLRDASLRRQEARDQRRTDRQAIRERIREHGTAEPAAPTPEASAPAGPARPAAALMAPADSLGHVAATPSMVVSAVTLMPPALTLRHVVAPAHERVIRGRSRLMPEVLRLATPPRAEMPRPDLRHRGDLGL